MLRTTAAIASGALLLLGGCGGGSGDSKSASGDAGPAGSALQLVVIGDSLIDIEGHCPECTSSFVDQFASHVEDVVGEPVDGSTLPGIDVPSALDLVDGPGMRATLAEADVIVVETGFNNVLPDPETGIGCGGDLGDESGVAIAAWIRTTTTRCMSEGLKTYGDLYDQIFSRLQELRGDKPTVYVLTNSVDGNLDAEDGQGLVAIVPAKDRAFVRRWTLAAYERWNAMLKERADAAGFQYVDLFHAWNGPDGTKLPGKLTVDGAHPSQQGHDLIAGLLTDVDLSSLTNT